MFGDDNKVVLAIFVISSLTSFVIYRLTFYNLQFIANIEDNHSILNKTADKVVSSVWCRGDTLSDRMCHFRNLCYNPEIDEFVFFYHPNESIIRGVPVDGVSGGDDNFHFATLTSVQHLNTHHLRLTYLPAGLWPNLTISFTEDANADNGTAIFLRTFKPDNLMHVVHDDLLPLFATLQELCKDADLQCFKSYRLVLLNHVKYNFINSTSPYLFLYSLLNGREPIHGTNLRRGALHCFYSAVVGISRETVWYQYGFHGPQGPTKINHNHTLVTIRNFIEHISTQLQVNRTADSSDRMQPYAVFFTRQQNRLVLNEPQMQDAIYRTTSLNVTRVDVINRKNFADIVQLVSRAEMVVGMHGAALILALFLRPRRILLELFPFAVPSDRYTPYRTMAALAGVDLIYATWENTMEQNNVAHPDRPSKFGGIKHLPIPEQQRILNSRSVRIHRCCNDPEWLYRIYQDTVVDVPSFEEVLRRSIAAYDSSVRVKHLTTKFHIPLGAVRNLTCDRNYIINDQAEKIQRFVLTWEEPWNTKFLPHSQLQFEIWLQLEGTDQMSSVLTSKTIHYVTYRHGNVYNCWVRGLLDYRPGPMEWIICTED